MQHVGEHQRHQQRVQRAAHGPREPAHRDGDGEQQQATACGGDAREHSVASSVVVRRIVLDDAAGIERPGVILATRPQALVTAPAAATLRFAGELLDYGQVAILEPAPDVLIVLAGLGEVYGEAGQILPEGAPVGLMGGTPPPAHAILSDAALLAGATRSETVYLEVREGGSPVDPATWFTLAR